MDWLNGTVHMPGMKTGLWLRNFPYTLSEIFVWNSTITVCHPLLYHTCCLTAQEQDGKVARVMTRVTAYNLTPNFHFVYIVSIVIYQLSFSTPHILHSWLAVSDHKWDQKFKSNMRSILLLTHVRTLDTVYKTWRLFPKCCATVKQDDGQGPMYVSIQ